MNIKRLTLCAAGLSMIGWAGMNFSGAADGERQPPSTNPRAKVAQTNGDAQPFVINEQEAPLSRSVRKAAEAIRLKLKEPISVNYQQTPLVKVVDDLATKCGVSFVLDVAGLTEEGVSPDVPVTLKLQNWPAVWVLDRILTDLGLDYARQDEVVKVTTIVKAEEYVTLELFNVQDLLEYGHKHDLHTAIDGDAALQMNFGVGPFDLPSTPQGPIDMDSTWLIDLLQDVTSGPWIDVDGTGGSISELKGVLLVNQTRRCMDEVRDILVVLRAFARGELAHGDRDVFYAAHHQRIDKALRSRCDLEFVDTPLRDVAKFFGDATKIDIALSANHLSEEGIAVDEPINASLKGITYDSALRIMLEPLGCTHTIVGGSLIITTIVHAEELLNTVVYDLRDFESPYAPGETELIETIMNQTSGPWIDIDGTGGSLQMPIGGLLVARQTQQVQQEVRQLLFDLRTKLNEVAKTRKTLVKPAPADPDALVTKYFFPGLTDRVEVEKLVTKFVEPQSWKVNGGKGELELVDGILISRNTGKVHQAIRRFLQWLSQSAAGENMHGTQPMGGTPPMGGAGVFSVRP